MRTMTTVSIELPPELLLLLDQHVRAGKLPSRSEAIAEAVAEWSTRKMHADYALLDSEDTNVFVREGDTLTHGDLRISLEFSAEDLDYVTIDAAVAPE